MIQTTEMAVATGLILDERARQIAKHGEERDITWDRRAVILTEEVGEVCAAIQDEGIDAILREAVHVAAVGMAMVEAALRQSGETPKQKAESGGLIGVDCRCDNCVHDGGRKERTKQRCRCGIKATNGCGLWEGGRHG
jgi:hypothetical protein